MPVFRLINLRSGLPVSRAALCLLAVGMSSAFAASPAAEGSGAAPPVQVKPALPTDVMNESVVTVDELIRNENVAALTKARKDAEAAGIIKPVVDPRSLIPTALPPAMMVVSSIAGVESDLRATFSYNGMTYERVRVGAPVGPCRVEAIQPRLVKLARKAKGTPVNQCPSGNWTGFSVDVLTSSMPGAPGVATSMPSPLTGAQPPRPYSSLGAVAAPRVPLATPDRPVVELVPSRPMGPGQTSATLTPRQFAPASDLRGASGSSSQPAD